MEPLISVRDEALARIASLSASRAELIAAAEGANADDEHDPEGATLAFEREQLAALLAQARTSLLAAEDALVRQAAGTYGRCLGCSELIGAERLDARPTATLCITCASGPSR